MKCCLKKFGDFFYIGLGFLDVHLPHSSSSPDVTPEDLRCLHRSYIYQITGISQAYTGKQLLYVPQTLNLLDKKRSSK